MRVGKWVACWPALIFSVSTGFRVERSQPGGAAEKQVGLRALLALGRHIVQDQLSTGASCPARLRDQEVPGPRVGSEGQGTPLNGRWEQSPKEAPTLHRVSHILNMAREIDNFYPERFTYHNVRLWDEESAQLLPHWKETHRFVEAARWGLGILPLPWLVPPSDLAPCPPACLPVRRVQGTRVLVHCKMGVSRSAATVMAYAMKQYGWGLERALRHVQELRPVARPNPGFLRQLQTYQGILTARHGPTGALAAKGGLGHCWFLPADSGPLHSRQSQVWEQKVSVGSPEQPLEPEVSTLLPPLLPESGSRGEVEVAGPEEEVDAPREEPGTRPRINLRGVMRSISLLEPPGELDSAPMAEDLPEVRGGSTQFPLGGQGPLLPGTPHHTTW